MAYSRYGHLGKGLTDRAQRSYNITQTIKRITSAPTGRGIFQDLAFTRIAEQEYKAHFTSTGNLRGAYEALTPQVRGQVSFADFSRKMGVPKVTTSQFGVHTAGYSPTGRGYPPWVMQMLGKGTELGKPPGESGGMGSLLGLATVGYLLLKVI
jgi:hypothetical protein